MFRELLYSWFDQGVEIEFVKKFLDVRVGILSGGMGLPQYVSPGVTIVTKRNAHVPGHTEKIPFFSQVVPPSQRQVQLSVDDACVAVSTSIRPGISHRIGETNRASYQSRAGVGTEVAA